MRMSTQVECKKKVGKPKKSKGTKSDDLYSVEQWR